MNMKKEKSAVYPVHEQVHNPINAETSFEFSYRQIENDGGYYYEFEEEYENYNSDYDLNIK